MRARRAVGECVYEGILHMASDRSDPALSVVFVALVGPLLSIPANLLGLRDRGSRNPRPTTRSLADNSPFGVLQSLGRFRV